MVNGQRECLAIARGIAQVRADKLTIFARVAKRAVDIDVARAQQDRLRAEELLGQCSSNTDIAHAMSALAWADARLGVVAIMADSRDSRSSCARPSNTPKTSPSSCNEQQQGV